MAAYVFLKHFSRAATAAKLSSILAGETATPSPREGADEGRKAIGGVTGSIGD